MAKGGRTRIYFDELVEEIKEKIDNKSYEQYGEVMGELSFGIFLLYMEEILEDMENYSPLKRIIL